MRRFGLVLAGLTVAVLLSVGMTPVRAASQHRSNVRAETVPACTYVYTVVRGDWLSKIAPRYGVRWQAIAATNRLPNPDLIYPGQRLCIGGSSSVGSPARTAVGGDVVWGLPGDFCPGVNRLAAFNVPAIGKYVIPAGCFSGTYYPGGSVLGYVPSVSWGWCDWWPSALHHIPYPGYGMRVTQRPVAGAIAYWDPAANGEPYGHYAAVEAVSPDGRWLLTSQMNYYWRGGGFGRVIFAFEPTWSVTLFYV